MHGVPLRCELAERDRPIRFLPFMQILGEHCQTLRRWLLPTNALIVSICQIQKLLLMLEPRRLELQLLVLYRVAVDEGLE